MIRLFCLAVPGVCALLAAIPAYRTPITKKIHSAIIETIAQRYAQEAGADDTSESREVLIDPVTREPIGIDMKQEADAAGHSALLDSFSLRELSSGKSGTVLAIVAAQFMCWTVVLVVLVLLMAFLPAENSESIITVGAILSSAVIVMVAWSAKRMHIAATHSNELQIAMDTQRGTLHDRMRKRVSTIGFNYHSALFQAVENPVRERRGDEKGVEMTVDNPLAP